MISHGIYCKAIFHQACKSRPARRKTAVLLQSDSQTQPAPKQRQRHAPNSTKLVTSSRRALLSGLTALTFCSCCPWPAQAVADFNYGHDRDPDWPGVCRTGQSQSPVDIPAARLQSIGRRQSQELSLDYRSMRGATVLNSAHGAQVNVPKGNILSVGGQEWQMVQFHFHTPSEHSFDGRHAAMEAHMVHQNVRTGGIAVLAVLLETASKHRGSKSKHWNAALEQALAQVPATPKATSQPFDLDSDTFHALLPSGAILGAGGDGNSNSSAVGTGNSKAADALSYVQYMGSLTTPPCTEAVTWFVLTSPATVAADQALKFQQLLGVGKTLEMNARPQQALHGRAFDWGKQQLEDLHTIM